MFVVYHLEMLIGQDLLPISIASGYGATLYFDGGQHEFQGNSFMVTAYAFKNCVTISHAWSVWEHMKMSCMLEIPWG